jgi:hypothetical protein
MKEKENISIKDLEAEFIEIRRKMRLCNDVEEMKKLIYQYQEFRAKLKAFYSK